MRSRFWGAAAMAAAMILCIAGTAPGQQKVSASDWAQIVEQMGARGMINWTDAYIEAVGTGAPRSQDLGKPLARPNALRAAQVDAYRNILEVLNGVRVDSTTTIRDFTVESDIINTQVQGLIQGAKVMKQEYLSDGTVEVTVRMPLVGNLSSLLIPRLLEKRKIAIPQVSQAPVPAPVTTGEVYTGLVVDARGIQARPAMSPRLVDERGQEIYGAQNVEREFAVQQGMSGYARDLTAAQSNPRVTNNPLSVKGIRSDGPGRSDIVVGAADAEKIRAGGETQGFMKKCRVMIVLD